MSGDGPAGLWIRNLVVDVPDAAYDAAVAWWSTALGGVPDVQDDDAFTQLDGVRGRVGVHVQRVGGDRGGYHLDLAASDVEAEAARLVGLGAERVHERPGVVVLRDPAGLPCCVVRATDAPPPSDDRDALHLRVLLLDVPSDVAEAEAAFWGAALGAAPRREERYPAFTALVPVPGRTGPTNLYVQAVGDDTPRLHVDLHAPDVAACDAAIERLVGLGASEVGRFERWVTVASPGGPLVCLVPDRVG